MLPESDVSHQQEGEIPEGEDFINALKNVNVFVSSYD